MPGTGTAPQRPASKEKEMCGKQLRMKKMRRCAALLLAGALLATGCAACAEARVNGVVVDATMNAVVVEIAPAQRIVLSTQGADVSGLADGLRIGAAVTLRDGLLPCGGCRGLGRAHARGNRHAGTALKRANGANLQ